MQNSKLIRAANRGHPSACADCEAVKFYDSGRHWHPRDTQARFIGMARSTERTPEWIRTEIQRFDARAEELRKELQEIEQVIAELRLEHGLLSSPSSAPATSSSRSSN